MNENKRELWMEISTLQQLCGNDDIAAQLVNEISTTLLCGVTPLRLQDILEKVRMVEKMKGGELTNVWNKRKQ